jgi:general secretion pathway protein B
LRPAETPAAGTRNPLEAEVSGYAPAMEQEAALAAAAPPPGPAAVTPSRRGSVVYQSLPEADPTATYAPAPAANNLPRADDMTARGALPELRLELHVWSTKPQERFVFVNGRRYREGDSTAEGATVEEITREGVIMNSGGNRFLLSRE